MLCTFLLYSKENHPFLYVYPLPFAFPSHSGHRTALAQFSALHSRFSLVI